MANLSPAAATSSPFRSGFQGGLNTPSYSNPALTTPSYQSKPPVSSSPFGDIKASSLPFDPSKPRPYVPPGLDPSVWNKLNSTTPFSPVSSTNMPVAPYLQRDITSPIRRPGYQPMKLPEVTTPKPENSPITRFAYSPMHVSAGTAAPSVHRPVYDPSQPVAGMETQSTGETSGPNLRTVQWGNNKRTEVRAPKVSAKTEDGAPAITGDKDDDDAKMDGCSPTQSPSDESR